MKRSGIIIALAVALSSCTHETVPPEFAPLSITTGGQTKTVLDGTAVRWTDDDQVAVFDDLHYLNQFDAVSVDNSSAVFEGKVAARTTDFYAVYPYACAISADDDNIIVKKIKSAVTDSEAKVRYADGKDGINNLMGIYSCCTGLSYEQIEKDFDGKGYGDFKSAVAEAVVEELRPFKAEFNRLINDKAYLNECAKNGAEKASRFAQRTLNKAMKKSGLYQL